MATILRSRTAAADESIVSVNDTQSTILRSRRAAADESTVSVNGSQSALNVEELADEDDRTEPKSVLLVVFLQLFLIG